MAKKTKISAKAGLIFTPISPEVQTLIDRATQLALAAGDRAAKAERARHNIEGIKGEELEQLMGDAFANVGEAMSQAWDEVFEDIDPAEAKANGITTDLLNSANAKMMQQFMPGYRKLWR